MNRSFQCFPDGRFYTIEELEIHLNFKFLSQIDFETIADSREIRKKGIEKLKNNKVNKKSRALGNKFFKQIKIAYIPDVSIRSLENIGYGLFSEQNLYAGNYVGEYTGIIRKNDRRYFEPLNNYCYEYPVFDHIGRSFVIDATKGNLTRFINHSFNPNLKPVYAFYEGFYHLIFLALRDIKKGTQLCYNYGQNYWNIRERPIII
jgi:uncharacterized protein